MLSASCGQQYKAESVVKDFMEKNLKDVSELKIEEFHSLDSTRNISDSALHQMQIRATQTPHYRQNLDFEGSKSGKMLKIIRVDYRLGKDKHQDTYYLDTDLSKVVSFKNNH